MPRNSINKPVKPDIGGARKLVWSVGKKRDHDGFDFLFNLYRRTKPISDDDHQKSYLKTFETIIEKAMELMNGLFQLGIFEFRLSVISPREEEERPYGNGIMLYCFVDSSEPDNMEYRHKLWYFLRVLKEEIDSGLYPWAQDHDDPCVQAFLRPMVENMALFIIFPHDRFMGGWSKPLLLDQYKQQDRGMPSQPSAPGQSWLSFPNDYSGIDWVQRPAGDW